MTRIAEGRVFETWYFYLAATALNILPQKVPTLYSGKGSVKFLPAELASRKVQKPLIVTDRALMANGVVRRVAEVLDLSRMSYAIYDGVIEEPTFEICEEAVELLKIESCDSVVAVGGGWIMDAAKIVRMGATHSKPLWKFQGRFKCRNAGLPFICIPAAAGTGSEATSFAFIMDAPKRKESLVSDPKLPSDVAILDPEIMAEISAPKAAMAGIHALTHAVEAYTNTLHRSDVDSQALEAVRLVFGSLRKACADGKDLSAAEDMLRAAHLAGKATARGYLGYIHALAHRLGERYGVQRGRSIAILLPRFLRLYADVCPQRLADMARAAGFGRIPPSESPGRLSETAEVSARAFADAVADLEAELGIPGKATFLRREDIGAIAKEALADVRRTPYPVPVALRAADLARMLESLME